ncbi:SPFH domain-containing protein [Loigolactobacillus backii]|uniref:Stomatin/prohibitin-family membrane protease subunit n=1 Tax=Loigolactobacillus backii TaxID=375175 RepID=A0A192H0Y7_9LACO|nr:SPFH domain-containing protein [Loigolactobacillus backii]ANK60481.1 stomatin/prohibitin-family membrane protease subunit [Loigolactobacillus backii]ANK62020.1 stomatin/prohibitin-family membrane protease subunit [Loigolactobacillus backii]ANK67911.1 stomatin/prohibitin-family membrane protease subunit [Loigolactobacillus backii]ANK68786.1 stomatin/prohibitin-family membrane protease subunit [Loigolactobacillus backii]MDA5386793.1 SPFH/Band 7/PHB domain protein [Loigolactobacillus backii]
MFGWIIGVIVLVVLILFGILFFSTFAIIHTGEVGIVERLGVYVRTLEPGFHVVLPIIYRITQIVNMKQIPLKVEEQEVITKDNVVVKISETLKYHITDVNAYVYKNKNSVLSMVQDTRANLRGIIGNMDLNDVLNGTEKINTTLFQQIASTTAGYGLNVDRVNIDSIKVDGDIQESMNKLLRASREKQANITEAEGYKQAAIAKAEGQKQSTILEAEANKQTQVLEAQGKAESQRLVAESVRDQINQINSALANNGELFLQYKNVEAMEQVAAGQNNTIVLPNKSLDSLGTIPAIGKVLTGSKVAKSNDEDVKLN